MLVTCTACLILTDFIILTIFSEVYELYSSDNGIFSSTCYFLSLRSEYSLHPTSHFTEHKHPLISTQNYILVDMLLLYHLRTKYFSKAHF